MKFKPLAAAAALLVGVSSVLAMQVSVVGSTFDISYDDAPANVGLFGAPVLSGNQLSWFPSGSPGFSAQTASGFGVTNSTFALKVTGHAGFDLAGFSLTEGGNYFFFGSGALVTSQGQLSVTPLPGATTATSAIAATSAFTANAFLDFTTSNWAAAAAPIAVPGGTAMANVSVQNILASFVSPSTLGYAFIEKQDVFLTVTTAPVPEPKTYGMMLAGLGVVAFVALRRRRRD